MPNNEYDTNIKQWKTFLFVEETIQKILALKMLASFYLL